MRGRDRRQAAHQIDSETDRPGIVLDSSSNAFGNTARRRPPDGYRRAQGPLRFGIATTSPNHRAMPARKGG
jgi:hypothetical protein